MKRFEEIREKLQILRKERDENPVTPEIIATCDDYIRLKDEIRAKVKNQPPDLTAGEFNRGE